MQNKKELLISLGWRCQYKCRYCVYLHARHRETLGFPVWADVLEQARQAGISSLEIGGQGEPTLSKDFGKIIACAVSKGYRIRLLSNVYDIKPLLPVLSSLESLTINLNALSANEFKKTHGVSDKGGFSRAINNLAHVVADVRRRKLPVSLMVNYVISRPSWRGAVDFPARLFHLLQSRDGVTEPIVVNFHHMLIVPGNEDLCPGVEDLTGILAGMERAKDDGFLRAHTNILDFIRKTKNLLAIARLVWPPLLDTPVSGGRIRMAGALGARLSCDACCKAVFVDCNGDVFGCYNPTRVLNGLPLKDDKLFYGNLKERSFRDILGTAASSRPVRVDLNNRFWKVCAVCGLKAL